MEPSTQAGPHWVWGLIGCCALLSAVGCSSPDAPDYLYGHNLTEIEFELTDLAMGVYPDQSVLDDPNNPFRESSIGLDTRWDIHDNANDAAGFYSWATLLAKQPNGENQFYTGLKLRALSEGGELPAVHEPLVRDMAIDGRVYLERLDNPAHRVWVDLTSMRYRWET